MPQSGWQPTDIAPGADGNVWFTEAKHKTVAKITPAGTVTGYGGLAGDPVGITAGPDGALWSTEKGNPGTITRTTTGGVATVFRTGITNGAPTSIATGDDGNLWFTEATGTNGIGRITPSGVVTEFSTGLTPSSQPWGITAGPDGNLWFTEKAGRIGRITTQGTITEFSAGLSAAAAPQFITTGSDGNLWFTEGGAVAGIGRITPQGTITEFSFGLSPTAGLQGITAGSDGALYFAEQATSAIGRITTSGVITDYTTGLGSGPAGITTGADGNLWFADLSGGEVGRMTVAPGVGAVTTSAVTTATATLSAGINPNSQATSYSFEYGPTTAYGSSTASTSAGSGAGQATQTASIGGLASGTTYHVRAVATNATGTTYGADHAFMTTSPGAPFATSQNPSAVTSATATLAATVNPQSSVTSYHFEWGTTPSFGASVPQPDGSLPADASDHPVTQSLAGLEPNTTYYYRVVASSTSGTTYGDPISFTTDAVAPDASTGSATGVNDSGATLSGTVNPRNSGAGWHFDYGKSSSFGSSAPFPDGALPADDSDHPVTQAVSGLEPNTTYHYRLVAASNAGQTADSQQVFTTLAIAPSAGTDEAQSVTTTGATLVGAVNAHNSATTYRFDWGETASYGHSSPDLDATADNASRAVTLAVASLAPDTTYHFRVVATSNAGQTAGADHTVTTAALAPGATTMDASNVTPTGATLRGSLDPRGRATTYHFEYGPDGGDTSATTPATLDAAAGATQVSAPVSGLAPGTTYRYRLVGESAAGSGSGAAVTFDTPPVPALGTSVVGSAANGTVRFRAPGNSRYTTLSDATLVPVGSVIDTRSGAIDLVTALGNGRTQRAKFWSGVFTIRQSRKGHGYADLYLAPARGCHKGATHKTHATAARGRKRRNSLWGRDSHGRFRGHGRGSIATVRGTTWLMEERCEGSYTRVKEGKVSVRDLRRHRTVLVRAGHGYLARTHR